MYKNGEGTSKDVGQSLAWFRKAADQGNAPSQTELGWIYREGRGIDKDDAQAVSWFRKGAEQNNSGALYGLGVSYATGRGVPKDTNEAIAWYERASQQGHTRAKSSIDALNLEVKTPKEVNPWQFFCNRHWPILKRQCLNLQLSKRH